MPLFQKAPRTAAELDAARPLDISPDEVLELDEEEWYARVYRGDDVPQLTWRAVLMGSALGFVLAFTNLYVGLKTGWALGVAITSCILSYAIWNVFLKTGVAKTPMTILETNCMQSTASAAGYATGNIAISAIPALLLLSVTDITPGGVHLDWPILAGWIGFLGALGTIVAIPMKRNMINREKLKFPSGTAAAVTLHSLYSSGARAMAKARVLLYAALGGAAFPLVIDLGLFTDKVKGMALVKEGATARCVEVIDNVRHALVPASSRLFDLIGLPARGSHEVEVCGKVTEVAPNQPSDWTMVFDHNPVMIAAGMLVGLRIAIYMTLGGLILIYGVGPSAYDYAWTSPATGDTLRAATHPGAAWKEIGIWLGVPIMVASGLLSFALQWKTIARAFRGLGGGATPADDVVSRTEVPVSWFFWGVIASGIGVVWMAHTHFEIPWHYGVLAIFMSFFLALVASRAAGESDITPIGAMGKIMQLTYGVLIPQSTTANLMTASISASAASSSADLLMDLKSGYLLGANPRRQFLAQLIGVISGTIAMTAGFYLLVPDASAIDGDPFPAPAAQSWMAVAKVFKTGLDNMHPMHQQAIFWGLALGTVMVLLERAMPRAKRFLPSATGLGLGLILPFQYPLSMLIGAVIAHLWTGKKPAHAEDYLVPVAAGVIAGVSLMGVIVACINNLALG